MELGQNLWDKIHILEDAPVYIKYVFNAMLHRVNGRRHTVSIHIDYFIDSLESFMSTHTPWRSYSTMVGIASPTSTMKAFVTPPRPPPLCAYIVLDQLSLVGF